MNTPHLILVMECGLIHQAVSNVPIDYTVIDHDCEGFESERLIQVDGDEAYCTSNSAEVIPGLHENLLTQIEQANK